jgi:hypothetical protein
MRREALFLAAMIAVSLTLTAGLIEGMARQAGLTPRQPIVRDFFRAGVETTWAAPDAELGWINKPGVSRSLEGDGQLMTFWSDGRRASRAEEKPASHANEELSSRRLPVMVFGGSNAQSYGVADADSFVYRLGTRYPGVWFENFGGGGYSTVQALLTAERALTKFYGADKPKLAILGFDDSHILRNVADQSWIFTITDSAGRYVAPPHYRLVADALVFLPFAVIDNWPLETRSAAVSLLHNIWLRSFEYDSADEGNTVTLRVLRHLADTFAASGTEFVVAILEDRSRDAARLLAGSPFPVVDCSGPERDDPANFLIEGKGHPAPRFHAHYEACIARAIDPIIARLSEAMP